jgi:NTE family protein
LPISINSIRGASELLEEIEFAAKKDATTSLFKKLSALRMNFSDGDRTIYRADQTRGRASERYLKDEFAICNLVLQGGGVLGLAHVGFIAGLEAAGIRFAGLAGTSAGAIVATTMACARGASIRNACSDRLIELLSEMPMDLFIDGTPGTRIAIKRMLAKRSLFTLPVLFGIYSSLVRFTQRRGLNPGIAFEHWLQTKFQEMGVETIADLDQLLESIHEELKSASNNNKDIVPEVFKPGYMLRVVANALPSGIKFEFPRDTRYLAPKYQNGSPAQFVRASMAIPVFFEPKSFEPNKEAWRERLQYSLSDLDASQRLVDLENQPELLFVDGGTLSNIPVDAFARRMPGIPTLALSLVKWSNPDKQRYVFRRSVRGAATDAALLVEYMRRQRDRDALERLRDPDDMLPDDRFQLVSVDTKDADWLNFTMGNAEMADLFMIGLRRAHNYIVIGG